MRKFAIIAMISMTTLAGCVEEGDDLIKKGNTITVCLDDVQYWLLNPNTQLQAMAPRIDPITFQFVRCDRGATK